MPAPDHNGHTHTHTCSKRKANVEASYATHRLKRSCAPDMPLASNKTGEQQCDKVSPAISPRNNTTIDSALIA